MPMPDLWDRWVRLSPHEFLRLIDADVQLGRWESREVAFLEYALAKLKPYFPIKEKREFYAQWLAGRLQEMAEGTVDFRPRRTGLRGTGRVTPMH